MKESRYSVIFMDIIELQMLSCMVVIRLRTKGCYLGLKLDSFPRS